MPEGQPLHFSQGLRRHINDTVTALQDVLTGFLSGEPDGTGITKWEQLRLSLREAANASRDDLAPLMWGTEFSKIEDIAQIGHAIDCLNDLQRHNSSHRSPEDLRDLFHAMTELIALNRRDIKVTKVGDSRSSGKPDVSLKHLFSRHRKEMETIARTIIGEMAPIDRDPASRQLAAALGDDGLARE